jgi:hypothetical protein
MDGKIVKFINGKMMAQCLTRSSVPARAPETSDSQKELKSCYGQVIGKEHPESSRSKVSKMAAPWETSGNAWCMASLKLDAIVCVDQAA